MSIDKTNMINAIQSSIDSANSVLDTCDLVALAAATNSITTNRNNYIALGCDLPDLYAGNTPEGTIYFVEEVNVPVVASDTCWLGLDGRLYRDDTPQVQLWGWGNSVQGSLATNSTICYSSPIREVSSSNTWSTVSLNNFGAVGVKTDGTLWFWGQHSSRFMVAANYSSPVQECTSANTWSKAVLGDTWTAAIKTDGTLWSWGRNFGGMLGNNSTIDSCLTSVQEATSSSNWCVVTALGCNYTNAIKTDGTLWSWGVNSVIPAGAGLGDNSVICRSSPVQEITSSTNWCNVTAKSSRTTYAIKTDGTFWMWGASQLGENIIDGTISNRSSPVQEVTSSVNWKNISTSGAVKADGTLWTWGNNYYGSLGTNNTINVACSPVQEFTSGTDWSFVVTDNGVTSAIKTNGTLWSMGQNGAGQLGNNTTVWGSSPVQEITSSVDWCFVDVNGSQVHSIKSI